jgi:hypothetical protein
MAGLARMELPEYLRVAVLNGPISQLYVYAGISDLKPTCDTDRNNEEEASDESDRDAETQRIWHLDSRIRALLSLYAL